MRATAGREMVRYGEVFARLVGDQ